MFGHVTIEICATLSVVQSFVSFHLLSLCPPLPTDNTYTLHCVSTCSPVVQFLRVASRCSPALQTPKLPQPQPTDHSSCRGEGQGRGSLHRHQGTQQDHSSTSHPSESSYGDVCGAVMCEECGGWVCCVLVLQTMPCSQHKTHCVNQHCISLYVLYSARNMFKIITGCDCYSLLVLRLPNDFLFHLEPKVARWDPLHQYWTTNSVLGWTSTWVGRTGDRVEVNMGGLEWERKWVGGVGGGMPMVQGVEVQCE